MDFSMSSVHLTIFERDHNLVDHDDLYWLCLDISSDDHGLFCGTSRGLGRGFSLQKDAGRKEISEVD